VEPSARSVGHEARHGALLALAAAALFGASTPLAKLLLTDIHPWLLAAVLYLGSGVGLLVVRLVNQAQGRTTSAEPPLTPTGWLWLGGAILSGGVVAPVLLTFGLTEASASAVSLLLNLEGVFTALLAWFVFHENFDRRIAAGMLAIIAGAVTLSWPSGTVAAGALATVAVAAACLAWALDNNLTRKVALSDPVLIAMLKGLVAGLVNLALALGQGVSLPATGPLLAAALVGFFGYGLSLVLFVVALRHVGAARTGAYFSIAPFVGAALSVLLLGEAFGVQLALAGILMAIGIWLHLTERHEHEHDHEALVHSHRHRHDAHHQHAHGPDDPSGEPHAHEHAHVHLRHSHPHVPDAHHRHRH
jgi:drug/metabolite transporter (DMT)-like permease